MNDRFLRNKSVKKGRGQRFFASLKNDVEGERHPKGASTLPLSCSAFEKPRIVSSVKTTAEG
jgi:hypothetical protein